MQKLKRQAEDIRQRYISDGEHGKPVGHGRAARLAQPLCAGYMVLTANPCWIHARVGSPVGGTEHLRLRGLRWLRVGCGQQARWTCWHAEVLTACIRAWVASQTPEERISHAFLCWEPRLGEGRVLAARENRCPRVASPSPTAALLVSCRSRRGLSGRPSLAATVLAVVAAPSIRRRQEGVVQLARKPLPGTTPCSGAARTVGVTRLGACTVATVAAATTPLAQTVVVEPIVACPRQRHGEMETAAQASAIVS